MPVRSAEKGRTVAAHDQVHMCYDRTSAGKKPMCATVCPSGALWYGTREKMRELRPNSTPVNTFRFGRQTVKTKVNIMMPKDSTELVVD